MAKRTVTPEVIDLDEIRVSESAALEVVETAKTGTTVIGFLRKMEVFFLEAAELHEKAKSTLALAEQWKLPTTEEEDLKLQEDLKDVNKQIKVAEEKWSITSTVHALHRTLTSGRSRTVGLLERAQNLGNPLHARYREEAQRAAAREQERIRLENEARARAEQEERAQRIEEEALQHELSSENLSERERMFVTLVSGGYSAINAAKQAGYKNPATTAPRLLDQVKIKTALEDQQKAAAVRGQAAAVRQQPVEVEHVEVRPKVSRATGTRTQVTWGYEMLDEKAFINAVVSGEFGLVPPSDYLTFKPAAVLDLARKMHERLDTIPGLRHKKNTGVV